jgi:hypothetical protein
MTVRTRRLVVGEHTYLWSVRHRHSDGRDCQEVLTVHRLGTRGRLRIVFAEGPGRRVPDGLVHSGAVGDAAGSWLNLHLPGTVRALLDAALAAGWRPDDPATGQMDGWSLFDAAVVTLSDRGPAR